MPTEIPKDFYNINVSNTINSVIVKVHKSYYIFIIYQYLILKISFHRWYFISLLAYLLYYKYI